MIARRTPLTSRAALRRTPLARSKPMRRQAVKARERAYRARVDTGPPKAARLLVLDRALGCCEICGRPLYRFQTREWVDAHSFHHRQPRGMGGTRRPEVNSPANLLLVCGTGTTGCHGHIEANRTEGYANGWLVRAAGDPAATPVLLEGSVLYLLTREGHRIEVPTDD